MAAVNPAAFGPGNWPVPGTLTRLSTAKQDQYARYYHFMAYIDTLSRSLSGYVSPAKFSEARWTAMLQIFVPQPDFGAFSYTNPNSLRSVFSKRKSTMYDLILENRSLSPALPAIAAQATAPGLSQTTATNVPNTNMLSAQAVGAAENDDDEEEGEEEEEEEEGEENKEDM